MSISTPQSSLYTWRRLSPIAIVYFIATSLMKLASSLIYVVPAMALNYEKVMQNPQWVILGLGVLLAFISVNSFLKYWFYAFKLDEKHIEIKLGIFKKVHIDLPFEKIQNVKLEQPIYYRIHNYAKLQLDTAGSAKQEASIVALPMAFAQEYKQAIMQSVDAQSKLNNQTAANHLDGPLQKQLNDTLPEHSSQQTVINNETLLNTRTIKDLVIHGISNNRVWILLGAMAPFYESLSRVVVAMFNRIGFDIQSYFSLDALAWWEFALHVMSAAMLLMLLVVLISILGSILMFFDYRLLKQGSRYICRCGLITKRETSMKISRLQMIMQQQDWLDKAMNRVNLRFEQNVTSVGNNQHDRQNNSKLIVPSVTISESQALIADAWPMTKMMSQNFKAISKRFMIKYIAFAIVPFIGSITAITLLQSEPASIGSIMLTSLIVTSVLSSLVYCRWKRWGVAFDNEFIYVRKGLIGVDYLCFPRFKIQQTKMAQTPLMRKNNLANASFVLASGSVTLPFISQDMAAFLIDSSLMRLESTPQSWM